MTTPGTRKRVRWNWGPSSKIRWDDILFYGFISSLVLGFVGSVLCLAIEPLYHDSNPIWTSTRVVAFIAVNVPIGAYIVGLIGACIFTPVNWLWRHPPFKIVTESPDLRQIYREETDCPGSKYGTGER